MNREPPQLRQCWVCLEEGQLGQGDGWVRPCHCIGTAGWVHQRCILHFIDEKQQGDLNKNVQCPKCTAKYSVAMPSPNQIVAILERADGLLSRLSSLTTACIFGGAVYWTAITFGAITVMQVAGHKQGLCLMERAEPLFLLVGLPVIPAALISSRVIPWDDFILRVWSRLEAPEGSPSDYKPPTTPVLRLVCGGLIFPTVATFVGKLLFSRVRSNYQRTLLGGIAFLAVKGALRCYYNRQQYIRRRHRFVAQLHRGSADVDDTDAASLYSTDGESTDLGEDET